MEAKNGGREWRQRMAGENGGKENSGRKWRERTTGKKMEDKRNKIQKNTTKKQLLITKQKQKEYVKKTKENNLKQLKLKEVA